MDDDPYQGVVSWSSYNEEEDKKEEELQNISFQSTPSNFGVRTSSPKAKPSEFVQAEN